MDEQLQNAEGLDPISFRLPLQQIVEPSVYSCEALPSRVLMLNQIMEALREHNLNLIGVYGMGGVGKTTLAKEVQGKAVEEKLFETVVMVPISQTPDLRRIQGEIAGFLNLQFEAEEILGRASELHRRLKKAKVLIILDDLWLKLDLTAVGIPEGCKMLLTSRKKDVLSNEMCTQKEFKLTVLEGEEAWKLFEMSVCKARNSELPFIAFQVARKCAGLPLLILKVATDLRNKDSYAWNDMLNQLSSLESTEIYEKVHKVIESSYEKLLDEEAKSLFLLCALFGKSNIRIQDLLIYCMGLGLFKHMDFIEGARNRILTLIDKLKDECLLLDGDRVGFVKIHDVVRDIALTIASRVQHAFVGTSKVRSADLRNKDCTRISLPYCDLLRLPGVLECPEAEVFSLFKEYDGILDIPNSFFEGVTKLKVVDFSGVHFIPGVPSSLGSLTGLQTLSLRGCWLDDVAIVAELKQLEFLCFADSSIVRLPREFKALTRLKLLDLSGCNWLREIPANVLSNLHLLEELYMLNKYDRWEAEGEASLVELKNLSHLANLEIHVKDEELLPPDWFFNGLRNYRISIGGWSSSDPMEHETSRFLRLELKISIGLLHRVKEFLRGTEVLHLGEVKGNEDLLYDSCLENSYNLEKIDYHDLGIESFEKLRILKIRDCDTLRNLFRFSSAKCLRQLQQMEVVSCENLEAILGEGVEVIVCTRLSSLMLQYLPRLTGFRKTSGIVCFPNLTNLEVYECHSLKYVFTTPMVNSLQQLKKLHIGSCWSMEEIVLGEIFEEIEEENIHMVVFPKLEFLHLEGLNNLKRFSSGYPTEFPKLREMRIDSCYELKNFVSKFSDRSNNDESTDDETLFNEMVSFSKLEKMEFTYMDELIYLWHQQFKDDDSFSKLKSLDIRNCSKLASVFPSNAYKRFQRLKSLDIRDCAGVEQIYEYEGVGSEKTNILQASALRQIYVYNLPSLKHIFSNEAFGCENLEAIEVSLCPGLRYVFPASTACGLLQLQHLKVRFCGVEMIIAEAKCEGAATHTFEWPELKYFEVCGCGKLRKFGANISEVIPNVDVLTLDQNSLKAIESDGLPVVELLWKLKEFTLYSLEKKPVRFLFGFLRQIYSSEMLTFRIGCFGEIFSLDDESAIGEERQYHPILKHLKLHYISDLKHILKKDSQLNPILQCLETLDVNHCDDLMNISPSSTSFQNLTTLNVESCDKMTSLVTASTAKTMVQLVELNVYRCCSMKEIVENIGDCTEHDVILFNKLKHLGLYELWNLNSFCSGNYIFNFPLLEQVVIVGCREIRTFCDGVSNTPKLQLEGSLNAMTAHQLEKNGFVHIWIDQKS